MNETNNVELVKDEILFECYSCGKEFGSVISETLQPKGFPSCQKDVVKYLKYFCAECARHQTIDHMPIFRCDLCNVGLGFCVLPQDLSKINEIPNTPDSEDVKFKVLCIKCRLKEA